MHRSHTIAFVAVAVLPAVPTVAATLNGPNASGRTSIVAERFSPAPDGNGNFDRFEAPVLNDAGHTAFVASLGGTSGGVADDVGLFRADGTNSLLQIVRAGQSAPDGEGTFGPDFPSIQLNESGEVAFWADMRGSTVGDGIFRSDGSTVPLQIVRQGHSAPGGNGIFHYVSRDFDFNDAGQVAFSAVLGGTSGGMADNEAIYSWHDPDGLIQIAREGQLFDDGNRSLSRLSDPVINDAGNVAFDATLTGVSGQSSDVPIIFRSDEADDLVHVARAGQTTPDGNGSFSGFIVTGINNADQVAFLSGLTGTSGGVTDDSGIFLTDGSSAPAEMVRTGQLMPNGDGSISFAVSSTIKLNDAGQVVFLGTLTGTSGGFYDDTVILRGSSSADGLVEVVRESNAAPTTDGNFANVVASMAELWRIVGPALNDHGQVAFLSRINYQDNGDPTEGTGLFFYDDQRGLVSVVRNGDEFDGSVIVWIDFLPDLLTDDNGTGLNNLGQVAFAYGLADGRSGIALTTLDSAIAGDANFDGTVDLADFGLLRAGFGRSGDVTRLDGDFNKDGVVDLADFGLLRANFGASVTSADFAMMDAWAATVPEPGVAVVGLAGLTLLGQRRRSVLR